MSRDLTPRQRRFACEYVLDWNATRAAVRAGYSERTAEKQGSRLLKKAEVGKIIERALDASRARNAVSVDSLTLELEEARREAMAAGQFSAAVSAVMAKVKLHGLDVQRHQVAAAITIERIERVIVPAGERGETP